VLAGAFEWQVHTAWQEIAENSVDMAHFTSVHGLSQVADISDLTMDGPFRTINSTQAFNTAKGVFEGTLQSNSFGPGLGVTHFDLMGRVTLLSMTTPIDEDSVRVRFSMFHGPTDEIAAKIAAPFAEEVKRQFEQDMPIWEAKRFVPSPSLAPTERPVTEFRRWASQFYAVLDAV
jgi:phenylpropionate dioxygenase-like ring-hydroxylating dioxygenase large terminal subunit